MNNLQQWLSRKASGRNVLVMVLSSIVLLVPFFTIVFKKQLAHGPLLDQMLYFDASDVQRILESYGTAARMQYLRGELIDLLVIPIVAITVALVITYSFKARGKATRLNLLPIIAAALNGLKVLLILPLVLAYPQELPTTVFFANLSNSLKNLATAASVILLLVALGVLATSHKAGYTGKSQSGGDL